MKQKEINPPEKNKLKYPKKNSINISPNQEIKTDINNNNNKRIYPKDPDFINNDMILIRNLDEQESDTFY